MLARLVAYLRAIPLPVGLVLGAFQVASTTAAFGSAGAWPAVALFSVACAVYGFDRYLTRAAPVAEELKDLKLKVTKLSNKVNGTG